MYWQAEQNSSVCLLNLQSEATSARIRGPRSAWRKISDSADVQWLGPGESLPDEAPAEAALALQPYNVAVYTRRL